MVINENILNKAVNESIDEFLLEEGWWDTAKNLAGKAWNWAKNGLAMYMDNATNGNWNREYNVHAKGKGIMVVCHYLKTWLQYYYNELQQRLYGNGVKTVWGKDENGVMRQGQEGGAENIKDRQAEAINFIGENCTRRNFIEYTKNVITDQNSPAFNAALQYIQQNIENKYKNPNEVIKFLNINAFYQQYGKVLGKYNGQNAPSQYDTKKQQDFENESIRNIDAEIGAIERYVETLHSYIANYSRLIQKDGGEWSAENMYKFSLWIERVTDNVDKAFAQYDKYGRTPNVKKWIKNILEYYGRPDKLNELSKYISMDSLKNSKVWTPYTQQQQTQQTA